MIMNKFTKFIPQKSLELVNYKGKNLINKLGQGIIANVVLSILCGENIRNLTENLTQRRILLMNASLFITYLRALSNFSDLSSNLTSIISEEIKTEDLSQNQKKYLLWFLGLTGKSIQNVIREDDNFNTYLSSLDSNLSKIAKDIEVLYGDLTIKGVNSGIDFLLKWPDLLRCMMALGAQTLTIRGSEKSMYGKFFEKLVLGSVLTILGFEYISKSTPRNDKVFWLSERENKRESDATVLLRPGAGIRFDIGFIGEGNTEISLDKVSRFERVMEKGGTKNATITIILIDKIGANSRTPEMAKAIGGHIIQMSGSYWVHQLAKTIHDEYDFFDSPLLHMTKEDSINFLHESMQKINLSQFL